MTIWTRWRRPSRPIGPRRPRSRGSAALCSQCGHFTRHGLGEDTPAGCGCPPANPGTAVIALAAPHQGRRFWDAQRRQDFANDPRDLHAVSPKANFDKAFRDAALWLPPNAAFRCDLVARQIAVKTT